MLSIEKIVTPPFQQNCLILSSRVLAPGTDHREAIVVDPGGSVDEILKRLEVLGLLCREIWLTHSHFDTCGAAAALKQRTGAILRAHPAGAAFRASLKEMAADFDLDSPELHPCPEPDRYFEDGEAVPFAGVTMRIMHTPGHTPDHVAVFCPEAKVLLCGDTMYCGAVAVSHLPGGDHHQLIASIHRRFKELPEDTRVIPGHYGETTLGREFATNPFLAET